MKFLEKVKDKLIDILCWVETYCWWLPVVIGLLAIFISIVNLMITIAVR